MDLVQHHGAVAVPQTFFRPKSKTGKGKTQKRTESSVLFCTWDPVFGLQLCLELSCQQWYRTNNRSKAKLLHLGRRKGGFAFGSDKGPNRFFNIVVYFEDSMHAHQFKEHAYRLGHSG
jgi:hypothetical protein